MNRVLVIAVLISGNVVEGHDLSDLVAAIRPGIVEVVMRDIGEDGEHRMSIRSGVVVDSSALVLTSMAEAESEITVRFHDGQTSGATLIAYDPLFEVALIQAGAMSGITPLGIAEHTPQIGEQVLAAGFSKVRPWRAIKAIVCRRRRDCHRRPLCAWPRFAFPRLLSQNRRSPRAATESAAQQ